MTQLERAYHHTLHVDHGLTGSAGRHEFAERVQGHGHTLRVAAEVEHDVAGQVQQHDAAAARDSGIIGNLRTGLILLLVGLLVGLLNTLIGTIIAIIGLVFIVLWLLDEL